MAVKSKSEILNIIKEKFSEDTSDETLAFLEDINDTLNEYEEKASDTTDWKAKYEQNDADWRKKYKDRFFSSDEEVVASKQVDEDIPINEDRKLSYDDLFEKGK